jgi:hypothetical protein
MKNINGAQFSRRLVASERLLSALAEQLKVPLLHIARQTELKADPGNQMLADINRQADVALRLLDGYLLSTQSARQQGFALEPISISSLLYEAAHHLSSVAKLYGCDLQLHLPGKYEPVLAHQESLQAALTSLGYSFIEAQQLEEVNARPVITLAAHRSRYGIVAGVFDEQEGLSTDMFRRAHTLYGRARQPLTGLSPTSGAGIFLADSLLGMMSTHLHVSHHRKLTGLAATLLPSQQLSLV